MNFTISIAALLMLSHTQIADGESIDIIKKVWTKEKAWDWYENVEPIYGCNYLPRTAVNSTEIWQAETFDPDTIDQELSWAKDVGYNSVRVFLQYIVWENDAEGLKKRMDEFLDIAYKHGIRTMFVPFCDCSFAGKEPYPGKQDDPIPGVHNSQWVPSPGLKKVSDRNVWNELERYIKDIIGTFGKDERVLIWDLYNEPGNSGMGKKSLPLAEAAFSWARTVEPSQPLTIGVWSDFESNMSKRLIQLSDVVSFHAYDEPEGVKAKINFCNKYGRPLICTEFLRRQTGNTFESILPIFDKNRVGWYNWGLVAGRTQTYMRWGSKRGDTMPEIWQHDVFYSNGNPYDSKEIEFLKSYLSRISFPNAVDSAKISVDSLDSILDNSLIIGNGDINALLYTQDGNIMLKLTKNDVWDARLDTSNDPPLPTLERIKELAHGEWKDRNWILPEGSEWEGPDSYHAHSYPCPRACANIRIGNLPLKLHWRRIRSQGEYNAWETKEDVAVMSIKGNKGASNGYAYGPLNISTDIYPKLHVRLSGTDNAMYYIDLMGENNSVIFGSKWIKSPTQSKEQIFELPPGNIVSQIILYTWTKDGEMAENRFESVIFEGATGTKKIDLSVTELPSCSGELDIRRAVAYIEGTPENSPPKATVRALADRNVFFINSSTPAELMPSLSSEIPEPAHGKSDEIVWLHQEIPGDPDWEGMSFVVALAKNGDNQAISIVTSNESDDLIAEAVQLAQSTVNDNQSKIMAYHEAEWRKFWSASGIEIDDDLLQKEWYRNLYFLRCVTKPEVISPGLFAGLINDKPAWHGDYHTNYNIQQTFWTSYITNHPELAEPYDSLIFDYMPRARWLAKEIFGSDGAYYPHVLFAYEPKHPENCLSRNGRQYIHHVWGFTIGVAGFTVQPLWYHYKYEPEKEFLKNVAYPAVRDVAIFYANFIDHCEHGQDGKIILAPSVSPEHWGWTPNFERNRNCAFDIAMIKYIFEATIEGAISLERDTELVKRLQKLIKLLPDYPTTDEDKPVVVDVQEAPPITYNIAIPAVPIFPGDIITWFSNENNKELFARSIDNLKWNGNNSTIILGVARARLSMPKTLEWLHNEVEARLRPNGTITLNRLGHGFNNFGHYTEQFAVSMAVSELLMQSVGDVIRIFPALPEDVSASFSNLRAQGGFLVSASHENGKIEPISIRSTVGGKLQLLSPWKEISVKRDNNDYSAIKPNELGIVELDTNPGENLIFAKRK